MDEPLTWYHDIRKGFYKYRIIKIAVILLVLLVLIRISTAATITGTVYDIGLEQLNNAIIEVNTEPPQKIIVKEGIYSFDIPLGSYMITAKYYEENLLKYEDKQNIEIKDDGEFVFDLILFPSLEDDEKLFDTSDLDIDDPYDNGDANLGLIIGVIVIVTLGIIGFGVWYFRSRKGSDAKGTKLKNKEAKEKTIIVDKEEKDTDEYYDMVLKMIKDNKRITQKEIRKEVPLSEAKISLIISELEHKGKIEKIKKGRGNILVLK